MKYEVTGKVAILYQDSILCLSGYQLDIRRFHVEPVDGGGFRVKGLNVKFYHREFVDVIDANLDNSLSVLTPVGKSEPMPGPSDDAKAEAAKLGIRFGLGIGAKTLAARIVMAKAMNAKSDAAAAKAKTETKATTKAARDKAAKARSVRNK